MQASAIQNLSTLISLDNEIHRRAALTDARLSARHYIEASYCLGSICMTVNLPSTFSATKLTLSPCFTLSSIAGSLT